MSDRIPFSLTGMDQVELGNQREEFESRVKECITDIQKRPSVLKPREITIKFKFEPNPNDPDNVYLTMDLGGKIPGHTFDTAKLMVHKNGQLSFAGLKKDDEEEEAGDA